jgi:hypothetical protein
MDWSFSDLSDGQLTMRIIQGDYLALRESVAESNALIRDVNSVMVQPEAEHVAIVEVLSSK